MVRKLQQNAQQETSLCRQCGKCCYFEIPATLIDLHRIAEHLGIIDREAFDEYIQKSASERSSLFMLQKTETRACVFLGKNRLCTIHEAKPRACEFYQCSDILPDQTLPWTAHCGEPSCQLRLWEQSLAAALTKAYIEKNGVGWKEDDYQGVLKAFRENTAGGDSKKVKLARDPEGIPFGIVYDCSKCDVRGRNAVETPVTLDDIERIRRYLRMDGRSFFRRYISTRPSVSTGAPKLIRKDYCILRDQEGRCSVEEVRPLHCRFVPCPEKVSSDEIMDRLYLGSGTIEQQFRHQVALAVAREYVAQCGTDYDAYVFRQSLNRIDAICSNQLELESFCEKIAEFRYVNDTLPFLVHSSDPSVG